MEYSNSFRSSARRKANTVPSPIPRRIPATRILARAISCFAICVDRRDLIATLRPHARISPGHFFAPAFALHDGNVSRRLQRQSPPHPIADTGHIRVRFRGAENDAVSLVSSPFVKNTRRTKPRICSRAKSSGFQSFVSRTTSTAAPPSSCAGDCDQLGSLQHLRVRTHLISFRRTTACPFLPVNEARTGIFKHATASSGVRSAGSR